ncbi:methionyl-tRNA formyltransferase [Chitinophaga oryziterrae]|uniref:Methionyl-tRNA formyltransferase n=1 Tax=Chitinophaga oryziterrae TaxID=1031224 RepID=A0A6N8JAC8_9BACT|nr:formyltransferase family protein [Chitinophaga oryziterrae]MVT42093.1 methionyl-tRNA formyltransferase [Chitinophaga oryziterrae]
MKFGFVTCVQLGLSCIESIYQSGGKLDLLITLHDNKARQKSGRIYLDDISKREDVELLKINHVNDIEVIDAVRKHDIDWLFIIGWSQIASYDLLKAPKNGCIGMHPTLLPVGRGRASIPWAIMKNLQETGVTMFKMDKGVDTGDIIGQEIIDIDQSETATSLYKKVNEAHATLIKNIYPKLLEGTINLMKQDESKATIWEGRTPADGEMKYEMKVEEVDRLVRATTKPYPGAFIISNNVKIIVWSGRIRERNQPDSIKLIINFSNGDFLIDEFDIEILDQV